MNRLPSITLVLPGSSSSMSAQARFTFAIISRRSPVTTSIIVSEINRASSPSSRQGCETPADKIIYPTSIDRNPLSRIHHDAHALPTWRNTQVSNRCHLSSPSHHRLEPALILCSSHPQQTNFSPGLCRDAHPSLHPCAQIHRRSNAQRHQRHLPLIIPAFTQGEIKWRSRPFTEWPSSRSPQQELLGQRPQG